MLPQDVLQTGVESYFPYFGDDGELRDPVFKIPTQYGTPYHAFAAAVLAHISSSEERAAYAKHALKGLRAALRHFLDPDQTEGVSGVDRGTGGLSKINHRDFFWPPILKTHLLLKGMGYFGLEACTDQIQSADILSHFRTRPPSNWSAVWLSGEWLRVREGLSPHGIKDIDGWLEPFFEAHVLVSAGFYQEPGHPNSYDLFTRYHFADMLCEGYNGRWRETLAQLMESGLRRSLAVQLSDGSLASAHRSTGQTWTLGAQCAYFTLAANYFADQDPGLAGAAREAARRALASFARWQRKDACYSPVENCLPPAYRVGYETYTADGHYASLALAFLAAAVLNGLSEISEPETAVGQPKKTLFHVEQDPIYRALAHYDPYSVHVNAYPSRKYDAYGIVDLTFGPNRFFQFASSVKHLESGAFYNLGTALRKQPGVSPCDVLSQKDFALTGPIEALADRTGFVLEGRAKGEFYTYRLQVVVDNSGVHVEEGTPGLRAYRTLFIPYLRDPGTGVTTHVKQEGPHQLLFRHGEEGVAVSWEDAVENILVLPYGYENRRGLCGLVRVDFKEITGVVRYSAAWAWNPV